MPQNLYQTAFRRNDGTPGNTQIVQTQDMLSLNATADNGWYAQAFVLPPDCDRTRGIFGKIRIRSVVAIATTGRVIYWAFRWTYTNPGQTLQNGLINHAWLSPDNWPADEDAEVEVTSDLTPGEPLFAGGVLQDKAVIGLRITRLGSDVADTYPNAIIVVPSVQIWYSQRCLSCGTC